VSGLIDWVELVPEVPICKLLTVEPKDMTEKSQPEETAVWSKDCSIGKIFTAPVVPNIEPTSPVFVQRRSVFMVMLDEDVVKSVAVPAVLV